MAWSHQDDINRTDAVRLCGVNLHVQLYSRGKCKGWFNARSDALCWKICTWSAKRDVKTKRSVALFININHLTWNTDYSYFIVYMLHSMLTIKGAEEDLMCAWKVGKIRREEQGYILDKSMWSPRQRKAWTLSAAKTDSTCLILVFVESKQTPDTKLDVTFV